MERCLVLSARQYDFKDDAGKQISGVTVNYLTLDQPTDSATRGCPPMTISAPVAVWRDLDVLPGYYDLDFRQRPGKGGKPTLMVVAGKLIEPLRIGDAVSKPS